MRTGMKRILAALGFLILVGITGKAIDLEGLEPIGSVSNFTKSAHAITFNCADGSQLQVTILAADLVRVRASFKKPFPARDHSWAIAKTDWQAVRWNLTEQTDAILITTDELEIVVH